MKPMLASNTPVDKIRFPLYASAKLDGVRGIVVDGQLRSRSLKTIPNRHISKLLSNPRLNGYDGELILGSPTAKDVFRQTSSATSSEAGAPEITFYVFDNFMAPGGFAARFKTLTSIDPHVKVLEHRLINNVEELLAYETEILAQGFEGLILRSPNGGYKFGRSTVNEQTMLKLKRFTDSEAVVIGVEEELANTNVKITNELGRGKRSSEKAGMVPKGRMGAIKVRDLYSGVEFNIGTGFNEDDRKNFWENQKAVIDAGIVVKYKSFLIGVKDSPRFPVYLGCRAKFDL